MENQELNLWLIKKMQTEGALQSEERRLEGIKREYNSEANKYHSAKRTFQSTRQKLLQENGLDPAARLQRDKAVSQKLKTDKSELNIINKRLAAVENRVRSQALLVLQNKRKLEALQEKINILQGRKISKKNLKEELEILDGRIQQMAAFKVNPLKHSENSFTAEALMSDEIKDCEDELKAIEATQLSPLTIGNTPDALPLDSAGSMSQNTFAGSHAGSQQNFNQENAGRQAPAPSKATDNSEFYEKISDLNYLRDDETEKLNLRYFNKLGNMFELQISRQHDKGLVVEIRPHSRLDTISLNSGKYEIIKCLKEKGLKLNRITVSGDYHAQQ